MGGLGTLGTLAFFTAGHQPTSPFISVIVTATVCAFQQGWHFMLLVYLRTHLVTVRSEQNR